jgi:copper(I)-binding protein
METYSDYQIEKYLSGVMTDSEKQTFEAAMVADASLQAKVAQWKVLTPKTQYSLFALNHIQKKAKVSIWHKFAWATPAAAMVMVFGFMFFNQTTEQSSPYSMKGKTSVKLELGSMDLMEEQNTMVNAGDTLRLKARGESVHVMVLYQDDENSWENYWGADSAILLSENSNWQTHIDEFVLDSSWKQEQIVVLQSAQVFSKAQAEAALKNPTEQITLQKYYIERK